MRISRHSISRFRSKIFTWWSGHKRDLPWRHTRDPYRILVSEIMLQQTQVSRVLPVYEAFLLQFPDVTTLADAPTASVLRAWSGMGYNRRALYLKRTAEIICHKYHGKFPETEQELSLLPGLGKYTARAVLVFAFEQDVAMVDTNIRQIITQSFLNGKPQKDKVIDKIADTLLPKGKSWEWHQALMDYGALALPRSKRPQDGVSKVKRAVAFKDTDRYYRGKIVSVLRGGNADEHVLIGEFVKLYGRPDSYISGIIDVLIEDGLVVRTKTTLHLPE